MTSKDKTLLGNNNEDPQMPSEGFRGIVEALVEEVVLNGVTFNDHKKYLQRYSQEEGLDYATLEKNLTDFFEVIGEWKRHGLKSSELMAKMLAKECYLDDGKVNELLAVMNEAREKEAERIAAEKKAEEERIAREKAEREVAEEAKRKSIEDAAYKRCTTVEGCDAYLNAYPRGRYVKQVQAKKTELEEQFKPKDISGTANGHDYVDLGLPSGTLWATCNIGANTPEEYGDYFAWGETRPKKDFDVATHKFYNGNNCTKYTEKDNLIVLQLGDDAAMANWGAGWHMPTKEEWEELFNKTSSRWTEQNGVYGRLFVANNGNSLFLPAAGFRKENFLLQRSAYGSYWSSSLFTDNYPHWAWNFYFWKDDRVDMGGEYRFFGDSVRAVRSGQN